MTSECYRDATRPGVQVSTFISAIEMEVVSRDILQRAIEKVADAVAERFLSDHLQDTLAMLNPEAVANLAVADAAGAIREALHKKLPDKILEVVRTEREVYQRGVFGGMTRIR
jgi:2-hydroxychromene-2-carboxylate isomerase